MKADIVRMQLFKEIDKFLEKTDVGKTMTREDRILKLSKPLTTIALNFLERIKV